MTKAQAPTAAPAAKAAIIIYGAQGSGKTQAAAALAAHYGCDNIVDEFKMGDQVTIGALHLTSDDSFARIAGPDAVIWRAPYSKVQCRLHHFDEAMRAAGLTPIDGTSKKVREPYSKPSLRNFCSSANSQRASADSSEKTVATTAAGTDGPNTALHMALADTRRS